MPRSRSCSNVASLASSSRVRDAPDFAAGFFAAAFFADLGAERFIFAFLAGFFFAAAFFALARVFGLAFAAPLAAFLARGFTAPFPALPSGSGSGAASASSSESRSPRRSCSARSRSAAFSALRARLDSRRAARRASRPRLGASSSAASSAGCSSVGRSSSSGSATRILRTGGAAAVSAQVLARDGASTVGIVGCGVNGAWAARCLAAAGYGPGVCADARPQAAEDLAVELGWAAGSTRQALDQDVVVTVTPGDSHVITADDLRPGQHIAALGADAHGKEEVELAALASCHLFCDEWAQASAGGELAHAVEAGAIGPDDVTQIGEVLTGSADGRGSDDEVTLFDSTGLAIQDLAICQAVFEAWREGRIDATLASL